MKHFHIHFTLCFARDYPQACIFSPPLLFEDVRRAQSQKNALRNFLNDWKVFSVADGVDVWEIEPV